MSFKPHLLCQHQQPGVQFEGVEHLEQCLALLRCHRQACVPDVKGPASNRTMRKPWSSGGGSPCKLIGRAGFDSGQSRIRATRQSSEMVLPP